MSDFGPAVKELVRIATEGGKDWELGQAANLVLKTFDPDDVKSTKAAVRAIGEGIKSPKKPYSEQVLLLVLGALIEAGASAELAWAVVAPTLKETLLGAAEFADACVDAADEPGITEAVRISGHTLEKKLPRQAAAWEMLQSRCLAAVAILARSPECRKKARASKDDLIAAAAHLEDLIEPVTFFAQVLKLIDEVPLLVIHPESRRGWRMVMNDVTTNLDMFVLLLDKLIGDPKKGMLEGARPNPKAVRALLDPDNAPKKTPEIKVFWNLVGWTGVLPDKTLADPQSKDRESHAHWVWLEALPIDIPIFEGERVVLFQGPAMIREYEIEAAFEALSPRIDLKSKVPAAEVDRLLEKMAKAAIPWRAKKAKADAELAKKRAAEFARAAAKAVRAARDAKAARAKKPKAKGGARRKG